MQLRVAEPEPLHRSWLQVVREHVRARDQPPHDVDGRGFDEIDAETALASIVGQEERIDAVDVGVIRPRRITARPLDLDDVGAEIGEQRGAVRARLMLREVEDADTLEEIHLSLVFALPSVAGRW